MVAITVILAAVIAAFVLDIGDLDDSAPQAQYNWESNSTNNMTEITHTSGDDIDLDDLSVTIEAENDGSPETDTVELGSGEFTAGDTITFEIDDTDTKIDVTGEATAELDDYTDQFVFDDEIIEVTITWEGDGTSTIIAEHEP